VDHQIFILEGSGAVLSTVMNLLKPLRYFSGSWFKTFPQSLEPCDFADERRVRVNVQLPHQGRFA
jgi:hypothetical protein